MSDLGALETLAPPSDLGGLADLPPPTAYDPSTGGSTLKFGPLDTGILIPQTVTRALAGAGKAFYDVGRGAGQWLGLTNRADVAESRRLDAPLMATTAGKAGDVFGSAAIAAPAMLLPGAQGPVGAGIVGGITGALQPSTSTSETLTNIGMGGASGAVGSVVGGKIADVAASRIASRQAAAQAEASLNAERDAVLANGRAAGYVVPPTAVNPSVTATALESVSGKAATRQSATETNQKVTNNLVRQDLGLPDNSPITTSALASVRKNAGQAYDAAKSIGPVTSDAQYANDLNSVLTGSPQLSAAYPGIQAQADQKLKDLVQAVDVGQHDSSSMVDAIKYLRNQAKSNFKGAFASGDPQTMAMAQGQQGIADAMEDLLKRNMPPDLASEFDAARTTIAKSHQVEAALTGNNVSATNLAAQMKRGKPVSGGIELASQFGTHFGDVAGLPKSGVGVSKLAATLAGGAELAAAYLRSPLMAAGAAGLAAAPYVTRSAILSRPGQALLAAPSYAPGAIGTAGLSSLEALGRQGGRVGAVPLSQLMGTGSQ